MADLSKRETLLLSAIGALVLLVFSAIVADRNFSNNREATRHQALLERVHELERWTASHEASHLEPVRRHY